MSIPKVIIDTDPGLDDAVALMVALVAQKKGQIEIVAITTVAGNTTVNNTTRNAIKVLEVMDSLQTPVYKGASTQLVKDYIDEVYYHGEDGFGGVIKWNSNDTTEKIIQKEHAVTAIIRLVREHPGEISIAALGPLTNIALAFKMDPEIRKLIKELYILGGNTDGLGNTVPNAEYNFKVDPEAAYVVVENNRCPTYIAPWELSVRNRLTQDFRWNVLGKLKTGQIELLNLIEAESFESRSGVTRWTVSDTIAVALMINKTIPRKTVQYYGQVELNGTLTTGQLVLDKGKLLNKKDNMFVIEDFDLESVKHMIFESASYNV